MPLPGEHIIYGVARDVTERKALEEELERQLAYTRRYGSGGAVLVIDLDRFKQINDEFAVLAGCLA